MKKFKKILTTLLLTLGVALGLALAFPFIFKDQLIQRAKKLLNENIQAEVGFSKISISILRDFPNVSMQLEAFTIDGVGLFKEVRLLETSHVQVGIDLRTVLNRDVPLRINGIHLEEPVLNILITESGEANYAIAKPGPVPPAGVDTMIIPTSEQLLATLEEITIHNAQIRYDDAALGLLMDIQGLNHQSHGDVSTARYNLDTYTAADSLTIDYGGIRYVQKAQAEVQALFQVNQDSSIYRISDNKIRINDLDLTALGFFQFLDEGYAMDFKIEAPENAFRNFVSLIPGAYLSGYEALETAGRFQFKALIKGIYNDSLERFPSYDVLLRIADGAIKYPDLPLGIHQINADMRIYNPSSVADSMCVDIPNMHLQVGNNPLEAVFHLRTPVSDPAVEGRLKGKLDLTELAQAFPIDPLSAIKGRITADITAKARMSQIDKKQYQTVDMRGVAQLDGVSYRTKSKPVLFINSMQLAFSPRFVQLDRFQVRYGKSDLSGSARVDNILAYFSPKSTLRGTVTLRSNLLDANEWIKATQPDKKAPSASAIPSTSNTPQPNAPFNRFEFKINADLDQINYQEHSIRGVVAKGHVTPNRFNIQETSARIGSSDFSLAGTVTDGFDYFFQKGTLGGNLTLKSQNLDLNQFMAEFATPSTAKTVAPPTTGTSSSNHATTTTLLVPERVALKLTAQVGNLTYTDYTIKGLQGTLDIGDKTAALREVEGQTLGGTLRFNGVYDTRDAKNPAFSVRMDVKRMDFQQAFKALNTFSSLAPVGEFLSGIFSSSVLLEGFLGKNMIPRLNDLTAKGYLETVDATISKFKPLQVLATKLNIQELKDDIRITDTKNWVEVKQGVVEVKPFDLKIKDIQLTIAGFHRLDKQIDYSIKARIPRSKFEKSEIGASASTTLRQIAQQASKLGLNIAQGEYVNLLILMTGTSNAPTINVKLLGLDGKTALADGTQDALNSQIDAQKKAAQALADKVVQETKNQLETKADSLGQAVKTEAAKQKAALEQKAKEALEKEVGKTRSDSLLKQGEKVLDQVKAKEEVDKMKKELEKFNPFKKKTTPNDSTKHNQ